MAFFLLILDGEMFLSFTPFILVELTDDFLAGVDAFPVQCRYLKKIKSYYKTKGHYEYLRIILIPVKNHVDS